MPPIDETIEDFKNKILAKPDSSKAEVEINLPGMILTVWCLAALFTDWFSFTDYYGVIPGGAIMKVIAVFVLLVMAMKV